MPPQRKQQRLGDAPQHPKMVSANKLFPLPGGVVRPLADLPNEIITQIGVYLDGSDLTNARLTCRLLHQLLEPFFVRDQCLRRRKDGKTNLEWAVSSNQVDLVKRALSFRPDTSLIHNAAGFNLVHIAAEVGDGDLMKALLDAGGDYKAVSSHGDTPLHRAALTGQNETTEVLLNYGADPDVKNNNQCTPIVCAAERKHRELVDLFLSHGASTVSDKPYEVALRDACRFGFPDELRRLWNGNLTVNVQDDQGRTLLHYALSSRNTEVFQFLIQAGADPNIADWEGNTALHHAAQWGDISAVRQLLAAKVDVNAEGEGGFTPLHYAVQEPGEAQIVQELVDASADVNLEDDEGWKAVDYAASHDLPDLTKILVDAGAILAWEADEKPAAHE